MSDSKVFVANLSWDVDDQELGDFFSQFGAVKSAKVILDKETGKSRGFGFVEFVDAIADKVISEANGKDLQDRKLRVNKAVDKVRQ
jgi:RNA recognition motif-containing protein